MIVDEFSMDFQQVSSFNFSFLKRRGTEVGLWSKHAANTCDSPIQLTSWSYVSAYRNSAVPSRTHCCIYCIYGSTVLYFSVNIQVSQWHRLKVHLEYTLSGNSIQCASQYLMEIRCSETSIYKSNSIVGVLLVNHLYCP